MLSSGQQRRIEQIILSMGFAVRRDQSYNVVVASASVDGFMDLSLALRQAKTAYAARFLNDTALVGLEEMKLYHLIQGRYWLKWPSTPQPLHS